MQNNTGNKTEIMKELNSTYDNLYESSSVCRTCSLVVIILGPIALGLGIVCCCLGIIPIAIALFIFGGILLIFSVILFSIGSVLDDAADRVLVCINILENS
jgi:hypothetical protein